MQFEIGAPYIKAYVREQLVKAHYRKTYPLDARFKFTLPNAMLFVSLNLTQDYFDQRIKDETTDDEMETIVKRESKLLYKQALAAYQNSERLRLTKGEVLFIKS